MLDRIPDAVYLRLEAPFLQGGIGRHVRHVLDHYILFDEGIERNCIDFDDRARDQNIEKDRLLALRLFHDIKAKLLDLAAQNKDLDGSLLVCHNGVWCQSSLGRELQHLLNHTVHHYAIVALILRLQNEHVPEDFGVAPSTLRAQISE